VLEALPVGRASFLLLTKPLSLDILIAASMAIPTTPLLRIEAATLTLLQGMEETSRVLPKP
jgi:hypothetical protein